MWLITIFFGLALGAVGCYGYFAADTKSPTALIPAAFGAVLLICGVVASSEKLRKHAMHTAVLFGLIGFIATAVMAGPKLPALFSEGKVTRANGTDATLAVEMQAAMSLICLVFVGLCINSFIQARILRRKVGLPGSDTISFTPPPGSAEGNGDHHRHIRRQRYQEADDADNDA